MVMEDSKRLRPDLEAVLSGLYLEGIRSREKLSLPTISKMEIFGGRISSV